MKILVLVKQVPETDSLVLDPETGTVVRSAETAIVNPLDLYAIEAALRIAESSMSVSTLALSMGPPQAESALREALAMGIGEAALVTGAAFAGADTWATAKALAAAARALGGFDLVFCGEKATDGDTGQVGPELAAFLGLPVITYVSGLELGAQALRVERQTEEGVQVLDCELPAVLSFCKALGEPRLPTLAGKRRAREAQVRKLGLPELGLAQEEVGARGSPTRVVRISRPKLARASRSFDARSEEGLAAAADAIVGLMVEKGLIVPKGRTA
jgi:electron transfer flavoprotein beta subunit